MEELFNSPWVLLVVGYVLARWDKRGDQQQSQSNLSTEIQTRLQAAEDWIAKHSEIGADFRGLSKGLETVTKAIDRLTERFDEWLTAVPTPQRKRA